MKCSGKQHLYPAEVEQLKKQNNEQKFNDVISQTHNNTENLEFLGKEIENQSENIANVTDVLHGDMLMLIKSLQTNFTDAINEIKEDVSRNLADFSTQIANSTLGRLSSETFVMYGMIFDS